MVGISESKAPASRPPLKSSAKSANTSNTPSVPRADSVLGESTRLPSDRRVSVSEPSEEIKANPNQTVLVRLWFQTKKKTVQGTILTLQPTDTVESLTAQLKVQAKRRKTQPPQGNERKLRFALLMESKNNTFYNVPVTWVYRKVQRENPDDKVVVANAVLVDVPTIRKLNPLWKDDGKRLPMKIPTDLSEAVLKCVELNNLKDPVVIRVDPSRATSPAMSPRDSIPSGRPSEPEKSSGQQQSQESSRPSSRPQSPGAGGKKNVSLPPAPIAMKSPSPLRCMSPGLTVRMRTGAVECVAEVTYNFPTDRHRSVSPARGPTLTPGGPTASCTSDAVTCLVQFYRGDTAESVMNNALARMSLYARSINDPNAHKIPRDASSLMMCCLSSFAGLESFSPSDLMPVYPVDGEPLKCKLIDLGEHYQPRGGRASGGSISAKRSLQNAPGFDYEHRVARCNKLQERIDALKSENAQFEQELSSIEQELAEERDRKHRLDEQYLEVCAAKRDMERLENLRNWFERELEERTSAEEQLRSRLLFEDPAEATDDHDGAVVENGV